MTNRGDIQWEAARKKLDDYRAGNVPQSGYSTMILQWGKTLLLDAQSEIEPFLYSPDASVRSSALHTLACSFHLNDYWPIAVQFLLYDSEYGPRTQGATALAWLKEGSRDRATLHILASVVRDPYEYTLVRDDAYQAMIVVENGQERGWEILDTPPGKSFDLQRDTDWNFVHACIDPVQEAHDRREALQLLEAYRTGNVIEQDYYAMLRSFARSNVQEARVEVEGFLHSPVALLRLTALRVLVLYLQVPGNWQMVVDRIQHASDTNYRVEAVLILGLLMRGTRDKKTLLILDQLAWDDTVHDHLSSAAFDVIGEVYPGLWEGPDAREKLKAYLTSTDA